VRRTWRFPDRVAPRPAVEPFYAVSVDGTRSDFFVSYTSPDEEWAVWIAHVLEEAGCKVILQCWDFRPGSNFVLEMQKALQSSDRMIAVLSPDYLAAKFPSSEWAAVFAADPEGTKKRLVPVMVRKCEPDGLLGQVVQIRIHNLDTAAARRALLDGVKEGRAKPDEPPKFPGAVNAADSGTKSGRLLWQHLSSPPDVRWRDSLDNRLPNQSGYEALELHLVPVGADARLQVRELSELSGALPTYGRQHGIFSPVEALDVQSDGDKASVVSTERGVVSGLAVVRSGQRSAWLGLPRDMLGAVLDEAHLAAQLVGMLDTLARLPLPAPEVVVPMVGIEPALMVSVGKVAELPRTSAQVGSRMADSIRPKAEDAIAFVAFETQGEDVAIELAARLVVEHTSSTPSR
jgi:hypothetical protein